MSRAAISGVPLSAARAERQLLAWLESSVVGLNLCPFARPLLQGPGLRVAVCAADDSEQGRQCMQEQLLRELDLLQGTGAEEIATTLLAFTGGLAEFDDYLDFLDHANALLEAAGLEGVIQLASFHPDYQFAGEPPNAASHYSNRAPLPVIHLLREDMVERALTAWPEPEKIPQANIARLNAMGRDELAARLARLRKL
ncbi:DUF1415 domain-containing protein [Haliea sp. E1-2-M8]|uniref:DUF1415 domain-containing protein n=1 Tax=Haliea sp. E1-2-M8 TaxID=3064706 RepID=UPI00271D5A61|nr:DUF1415 domain-containing protein [Haliea sp. E1-2-M8]MDO8860160.1 DUF1415 domain-containing protein [Haliea sp. E1-2-M8]